MSLLDPISQLTVGTPKGAAIFIPNGVIQDMTEPTLVHGWFDGIATIQSNNVINSAAGYLVVGLRVLPEIVSTIAETPGPFSQADGDWLYHRVFPLARFGQVNYEGSDGTLPVSALHWHDEVSSARKLHEDEKVVYVYEWVDADFSAEDSFVHHLGCFRYLLRQP